MMTALCYLYLAATPAAVAIAAWALNHMTTRAGSSATGKGGGNDTATNVGGHTQTTAGAGGQECPAPANLQGEGA